jgi:hypothetical protein
MVPGVAKMPLPITREMTRMKEDDQVRVRPRGEDSGSGTSDVSRWGRRDSEVISSSEGVGGVIVEYLTSEEEDDDDDVGEHGRSKGRPSDDSGADMVSNDSRQTDHLMGLRTNVDVKTAAVIL